MQNICGFEPTQGRHTEEDGSHILSDASQQLAPPADATGSDVGCPEACAQNLGKSSYTVAVTAMQAGWMWPQT